MHEPSNVAAPDALLMTAREALKDVLREPEADHRYTIRMAMNAMGIGARAMRADDPPPIRQDMDEGAFKQWVRRAEYDAICDPSLLTSLRRYVDHKLTVANPRYQTEKSKHDQ